MELTMASQADPTPWELPTPSPAVAPDTSPSSSSPQTRLVGREFFSLLGVVRRKPARGDAPQTLSKSCSDKLALRQVSSLLAGGGPSLLVATSPGLYLASVVMPASQVGDGVGCTRAFSGKGRMKAIEGRVWSGSGPLAFRPFVVRACSDHVDDSSGPVTSSEGNMLTPCYRFSRSAVAARAARAGAVAIAPSNLSVAWTATGLEEALTGGTVDGRRAAVDVKAAGKTSRLGLWRLAVEVAALLDKESSASGGDEDDRHSPGPGGLDGGLRRWLLEARTYGEVKKCPLLKARREVLDEVKRTALQGWIPNERDEDFGRE